MIITEIIFSCRDKTARNFERGVTYRKANIRDPWPIQKLAGEKIDALDFYTLLHMRNTN